MLIYSQLDDDEKQGITWYEFYLVSVSVNGNAFMSCDVFLFSRRL